MNKLNTTDNKFTVTALYARLSKDDMLEGESNSITNQVVICKGGILPPNTYYDCGSFVVNRKAVVGKERIPYITAENSTQKGAVACILSKQHKKVKEHFKKNKPYNSNNYYRAYCFYCFNLPKLVILFHF